MFLLWSETACMHTPPYGFKSMMTIWKGITTVQGLSLIKLLACISLSSTKQIWLMQNNEESVVQLTDWRYIQK